MSGVDRRGLTLVELLVAIALASLLMTLIVWFLVPSFRLTARGSVQAALQSQASFAEIRLIEDLQKTTASGVTIVSGAGGSVLALAPISDVSSEGTTVWSEELVVYYVEVPTRRLMRKVWPPAPPPISLTFNPARPARPTAALVDSIASEPNGSERSIASDVSEFQVTHAGLGEAVGQPLTIRLRLEQQAVAGQVESFEMKRDAVLRNSGNVQ